MPSDPATLWVQLQSLRDTVHEAMLALPGVTDAQLFGSLANGGDGFADIDMQLISVDPVSTLAALHSGLAQVGPVALEWVLRPDAEQWVAMIFFRDHSPYHKLDLGISRGDWSPAQIVPGPVAPIGPRATAGPATAGYSTRVPAHWRLLPGAPDHYVVGQLIAGTRYAKARRRGRLLTAWRFADSAVDALVMLLFERCHGWAELGRKPNTPEFSALDAGLSRAERERFYALLDFSSPAAMDCSLLAVLREILALGESKSNASGCTFAREPAVWLLESLEGELAGV